MTGRSGWPAQSLADAYREIVDEYRLKEAGEPTEADTCPDTCQERPGNAGEQQQNPEPDQNALHVHCALAWS